jgi:hypothetical protein
MEFAVLDCAVPCSMGVCILLNSSMLSILLNPPCSPVSLFISNASDVLPSRFAFSVSVTAGS